MQPPHHSWFYRAMRSVVTLHGSPEAIALGTAIGVFIAFTPTVGFQMALGAFFATLVGANRPAAMIPAWITNPLTIPPVFAFTYWLGSFIWPGPSVDEVYRRLVIAVRNLSHYGFHEIHKQFAEFFLIGVDIYVAMFIGGVIVGGVCAAVSYPLTLWAVRRYRLLWEAHRARHGDSDHHDGAGRPDVPPPGSGTPPPGGQG